MLFNRKPETDEKNFVRMFKKKHMLYEKEICAEGTVNYKVAGYKKDINLMFKNGEFINWHV